ncbi:response regulator [Maribacter sp.]|uniref:response regulator n=1 Tax=Maribacter sp. TaxID=1897614 RepID=UPI003298DC0B
MIKILLIEDDEVTNFIAKTNLEKFGYKNISIALNGQEGLEYLKNNNCPDVIILDINMPVLDGWDFLEATRKLNFCTNVPVIIATSSSREDDVARVRTFENVMEYLEKPLNFKELNSIISKVSSKSVDS